MHKEYSCCACFSHRLRTTKEDSNAGYNKAERNHFWKGGKSLTGEGYIRVRCEEDHPKARSKGQYILEHRLVMEQHLGRYLNDDEVVHHKNGIKHDNRLENLVLLPPSNHMNLERRIDMSDRICLKCGTTKTFIIKNLKYGISYLWYHGKMPGSYLCVNCYNQRRRQLDPNRIREISRRSYYKNRK